MINEESTEAECRMALSQRQPRLLIQFRLWHAWILITAAAIGLAIIAPYLRALTEIQWMRCGIVSGSAATGVLIGWLFYSAILGHSRRRAGVILFELSNVTKGYRWMYFGYLIGPLGLAQSVLMAAGSQPSWFALTFIPACAGMNMLIPKVISTGRTVWVAENGLIWGFNCFPWGSVTLKEHLGGETATIRIGRFDCETAGSIASYQFIAKCSTRSVTPKK